jgi:hypothetical protein
MFEKDVARMENFKDLSEDAIRSIKSPALFLVADHDVITIEHRSTESATKEGNKLPEIVVTLVEEFLNDQAASTLHLLCDLR